uniref:STAS domain-containing protein n=1 Tax=Anopheles coluzzii TaxID=1518534 RepID=A0A8W7PMX4_ANOCL
MVEAEELRALRQEPSGRRITIGREDPNDRKDDSHTTTTSTRWETLLEGLDPKRRLPILTWIRKYDGADALSDLIAGVTLGLTMIPQSIAYATIAGLPSQYGLYAAFMGSLVYVFCGTVREVSIGPTSLMSLLTLQYTAGRPVQYVIVLAFAAGLVELAMGAFRLGFLVCFISAPVTSAFTSATALIIIGAQLGNLLGLPRTVDGGFFATVWSVLSRLADSATGDTLLGIGCIMLGELGSGLVLVPLVAVLANVAIAKAFASDGVVDATQELFALGLCNVIGSCFRAMPTTGAFTRSAVSHASGVRTPLAGLYSALLTLLALGVLTPYFYYIPRTTLAAVLITAVASMLDLGIVRRLARPPALRTDLLAWTVCFAVCLVQGVEVGLLCGMAVSLLEPLRHWVGGSVSTSGMTLADSATVHRCIRPEVGLLYTGVDRLRTAVLAEARRQPALPLVLDCERLVVLDYSAARALRELADEVARYGAGPLVLVNVRPGWCRALELHQTDEGYVFKRPEPASNG